jgi:nitrile hydratase subunit beta
VNGVHDMGGLMNFGPVDEEPNEPTFHAEWEKRVFGLALAMGATRAWTGDGGRSARESIPPALYLSSSYFEIWVEGLQRLLLQTGLVTADEIHAGRALEAAKPLARVLAAEDVPSVLANGSPFDREIDTPARFAVGDAVLTRNINPTGHTRLPRYARAKRGVVERIHGAYVLPDTNAHGEGESPEWLHTVAFTGTELWGQDVDPTLVSSIDAWESYLEPA